MRTRRPGLRRRVFRGRKTYGRRRAYPNPTRRFIKTGSRRIPSAWTFFKFPIYQPFRVRWQGMFCQVVNYDKQTAQRFSGRVYRANSIRDPDAVVGVGQPSCFGFATIATLYDVYRVYKTQVQLMISPGKQWTDTSLSNPLFEGQALYIEAGRTWQAGTDPTTTQIVDSIRDRQSGVVGGVTSMPAIGPAGQQTDLGYPAAMAALMCNGAEFQGSIRTKKMRIPSLSGEMGRYRNRLAQTFDIARFSSESQSFRDWCANNAYESLMTNDPEKGFFIGCGVTNMAGDVTVVPVVYNVKIKYTCILTRPKRAALLTTTDALDPVLAANTIDVMQRTTA